MVSTSSTAAPRKARKQQSEYGRYYYQTYLISSEGELPQAPSGDPAGDESWTQFCGNEFRVEKRRFEPLKAVKRFRCLEIEWMPAQEVGRFDAEAWACRLASHPAPKSLVDIPKDSDVLVEHYEEDGDVKTRAQILATVAECNRKLLRELEGDDPIEMRWCIAIEIGQPNPLPATMCTLDADGMGHQEQCIKSPIRIVVPTAEEVAKYGDTEFVADRLQVGLRGGAK